MATPVALYLRKSEEGKKKTAGETMSVGQQRTAAEAYAKANDLTIVAEYCDDRKSGSRDQAKRLDFQRMLFESATAEWEAVLTWRSDRFGRQDSVEGSFAAQTLRLNGKYLLTVTEGKIDWNTTEGRMKHFMTTEGNSSYVKSFSESSVRGRNDAFEAGNWPFGSIPYGYDRLYTSKDGNTLALKRTDAAKKPPGWKLSLTVNEEEAKVVLWLFEQYANKAVSLSSLAQKLATRGVEGPASKGWNNVNVSKILANRAYVTVCESGKTGKKAKFSTMKKTAKAGMCPRIVEDSTFALVASKLANNNKPVIQPNAGPLSGLLICGDCKQPLRLKRAYKNYYACTSKFKRPDLGCTARRLRRTGQAD